MKRIALTALLFCVVGGGLLFLNAAPKSGKGVRRISEALNTNEAYSVIAVIPDVNAFISKLREGEAMRAFFDSPLGLHFLRSVPTRGGAHLHKMISMAPKSWQWNLYTLITDGPVFYRSAGKKFSMLIALNNKGKLLTSMLPDAYAAKEGEWLVIASDKETLETQVQYLRKPSNAEFALDAYAADGGSLAVAIGQAGDGVKKKSLTRALLKQAFGNESFAGCLFKLRPGGDSLSLEGECPQAAASVAGTEEKISLGNFPGYAYFRKAGSKTAHVIALGGFTADAGYMIPHVFYSGPAADQKSIEFLSQAFKTKNHKLETKGEGFQITYPSPYSYRNSKIDLFAPHLVANRERFFWQSYLTSDKKQPEQVTLSAAYNLFAAVKIHPLIKNSEAALKQFDAIYSPGHFNEFRDALTKSIPALKKASLRIFTQQNGSRLRVGGALNFADT